MAKNKNKDTKAPEPEVPELNIEAPASESTDTPKVQPELPPAPEPEVPADVPAEVSPVKVRRPETYTVSHNAALIEWPTDIWGLTKDLKKAFLVVASRINGQEDKKELVDAVLRVAHLHLEAKYTKESELRAARIAKAEAETQPEQLTLF